MEVAVRKREKVMALLRTQHFAIMKITHSVVSAGHVIQKIQGLPWVVFVYILGILAAKEEWPW